MGSSHFAIILTLASVTISLTMCSSFDSSISKDKSELDPNSNFFWLKRDSISYPDLFRNKKITRKHLKQILGHKKKKALRRKQQQLLKNRILPAELPKRPNIILMMSDDQDTELGSLKFMPKLNRYLKEDGKMI